MANIVGDYPDIEKVPTGYWSLDKALSGGWVMTPSEIFGFGGIGKSVFCQSIAGTIAEYYKKNIAYAVIEPTDKKLMNSILDAQGFSGKCTILMEKTDEEVIDKFIDYLNQDAYAVGVFDSLSAINPIAETESSSADAIMGRRAMLGAKLARKLVHTNRFRKSPVTSMIITHKMPSLSNTPTNTGTSTAGGEVKKNLSKVRIGLRRLPEPTMNDLDENAYILEGTVEKFNFGRDKRKFFVAVLGNRGIHMGLTAFYDCKKLGIASTGRTIKVNGQSIGSMREMVGKAYDGNDKYFEPFLEALQDPSAATKEEADPEDEFGEIE